MVTDVFHPVYETNPVHLPTIHNNCSIMPSGCVLNVSTVSQLIYPQLSALDIALQPIAASEIRTKLNSRQSVLFSATGNKFDFKETDGGNICAEINQASIDWAISKTPKEVLDRYLSQGKLLTVGTDIGPLNAGPLWIWTALVRSLFLKKNYYLLCQFI